MPDLDLIKQAEQGVRARRGHCSPAVRASLKPLGIPVDQFLERAAVPPTAHDEELSVAEFCVLARTREGEPPVWSIADRSARAPSAMVGVPCACYPLHRPGSSPYTINDNYRIINDWTRANKARFEPVVEFRCHSAADCVLGP